jgi:hypothetical protein
MPAQLRVYKIKPGKMDDWLKFFNNKVVPMHRKFGIPARIAWINHADSEFIWARDFFGDGTVEEQEANYVNSEERRRVIGDEAKQYIDGATVRVVDLAYEDR